MARGQSDDIERNASVATRSKSIVSLSAFEGMDEYSALQKYIQFYRDPRAAQLETKPKEKKNPWWKFWASNNNNASALADAAVVPDDVRSRPTSMLMAMPLPWLAAAIDVAIGTASLRNHAYLTL